LPKNIFLFTFVFNKVFSCMSDKNSNRISLIIAVIAIVLILGGVYLLNKSFSSPSKTAVANTATKPAAKSNTAKTTTSSSSTASGTNTSVTAKTSDSPADTSTKDKASSTATAPADSKSTTITSTEAPKPAVTTTPKTEDKPKPAAPVAPVAQPLAENEILATYLGPNSVGQARFEIQECGKKGATSCTNPNKFSINKSSEYGVALVEGSKYKFVAKYTEDTNFILFESISSITEAK
jgi:FtsZ-interacting cell division protein ZipA